MSSSMLSGERRWSSARRGGMTVLGKVAVPKPINLPSQRLENHGLDPNVEIVPKGTHSWGSKSSSSSSNAWGSSSMSPNTDGGTGSPNYLSGRPSSGGTGTRPSTAGSESNAWGSSSRPSSSSGVLTSSNQTLQTASRPRSADTRPGSSQLSRFAEPLSDNSVAWGGSGTSEKLGMTSSKNDGFSLSTGDFPSLGSEKDNCGKNTDSQDHGSHGRPGSASSGVASLKDHTADSAGDVSVNVNANAGGAGSWRKESCMYGEDGGRPNVEKWHADPQQYPNSNTHNSQHFDSWHAGPVNNHPGGVWYRGPPGGQPFGSPIPPGGFPMEPFPYYHPQMAPPLANPQPVRQPNNGPRGSHLKNGDMYRPHMHDPYVRPGMPLRPGFYPGPVPFPYDNYYGPPMGYCNSNERGDAPFMGMAMGPAAAYNRYPGQNVPDPGNPPLVRPTGHGPSNPPMVSDQVEAVHPHQDTQGPYKVLLKQHESWEARDEEHKWDDNTKANSLHSLKREPPRKKKNSIYVYCLVDEITQGWSSMDQIDSGKLSGDRVGSSIDNELITRIEQKLKEHADVLLHSVECLSARVSQIETRTRQVENSFDELKEAIEFNHGKISGKLMEMENVLMEVHNSVKDLRDKQEIAETQQLLAKLQVSKNDPPQPEKHDSSTVKQSSGTESISSQHSPSLPSVFPQPIPTNLGYPPATAPQVPSHFSQSIIMPSSFPHQESFYSVPPAATHQPPTHQSQSQSPPPPPQPHQHYQGPTHLPQNLQLPQAPQPFPPLNNPPRTDTYHPEEQLPYFPSHGIQKPSERPHQYLHMNPPPQRSYDQPSNLRYPEATSSILTAQGLQPAGYDYHYNSPRQSGNSVIKPFHGHSLSGPGGEIGYSQLPTARVLPQAIPTASSVVDNRSSSSESSGGGNRVPVDDVIDKVVSMGFRRDVVRATVNKLTENGQHVDLNIVLDKLMNNS